LAYQAGKPIVSDQEYDKLKAELRKKNSVVVQQVLTALTAACVQSCQALCWSVC
jgi:NAD-dependent DNA ligase